MLLSCCCCAVPYRWRRHFRLVLPQFDQDVGASWGLPHSRTHGRCRAKRSGGLHQDSRGQEAPGTNPVNEHTVFGLASIRTFAAVLAGQASLAGEINLNSPLSRYLPGFRLKYDTANRLTLQRALSYQWFAP